MKVQKRFGSLLLAALLAVSLLGMPSARAAATDVALTAGETDSGVKLTVTAKTAFESVGGLSFSVEYNTDAFSLTSVSSPVDAEPSVNNETSTVTIFSETGVPVAAEAALAELNFTKKDGFLKGTEYPFTLRFSEAFDAAAEAYDWAQESYSAAYYEEPDMPENGTVNLSGISIRKTVETDSAYDPVTFSFTAESKSAPAGATPPSFGALSVTMQGTADSAQVSLPDEIWVDAPGTYEYTVRETAGSAGGWTYDSSAYVLQLEIDRNTDGFFLKEWHAVAPGGNTVNEIAFKNTYVAPQPAFTPPSVQFKVRQVINLGNSGLSSNDVIVRYTLKGVTANAPLPSTAKNDAFQVALRGTGTYQAPAITFSEPGTWKYDLTAVSNNADMSPQTIIITVTVEPTGEAKVSSALTNGTACEIQFTANAKAAATPTPTPTPRPTPSPTPTPKPGTVQTPTPTPRITPTPTPKNSSGNTPKTADTPRVFVFGLIALIATAILAVLAAWEIKDRRKKRN